MYESNVERILALLRPMDVVLDIGGWARPFNRANYIMDAQPYETRGYCDKAGYGKVRPSQGGEREFFTKDSWIQRDICDHTPFPFADKELDFVICADTLEDIRDPIWVCSEMIRIAKRGYLEVPSRVAESSRGIELGQVGWSHHRWLVDIEGNSVRFLMKFHMIHSHWRFSLPESYLRCLSEEERTQWLFWDGSFNYSETLLYGADEIAAKLERFVQRVRPYPDWRLGFDGGFRRARRLKTRVVGKVQRTLKGAYYNRKAGSINARTGSASAPNEATRTEQGRIDTGEMGEVPTLPLVARNESGGISNGFVRVQAHKLRLLQGAARKAAGALGRESWFIQSMRPAYESILVRASGGRGIPWDINGATFRVDPHHRHRFGQDYEAPVAAFLREQVKPGAVCLNVGANVGVYVLQLAHWSQPTGRVVAFEPNPNACSVLQRHIRLNGLSERVEVVPAAVGAVRGEAVLYAADSDGMSRLGAPNEAIADRVTAMTVPVLTLDDYCEAGGLAPDWLLIDIEGFEIAALAGARQLIKSRGKTLGIIVEMHPNVWDSAGTSRDDAEALLDDLELEAVPLTGQKDPLSDYGLVYLAHR